MKLLYYPETDSLYIELRDVPGAETRVVAESLNVDLDAHRAVLSFDIATHSHRLDVSTVETIDVPFN